MRSGSEVWRESEMVQRFSGSGDGAAVMGMAEWSLEQLNRASLAGRSGDQSETHAHG